MDDIVLIINIFFTKVSKKKIKNTKQSRGLPPKVKTHNYKQTAI